jgi:hypothetical protein
MYDPNLYGPLPPAPFDATSSSGFSAPPPFPSALPPAFAPNFSSAPGAGRRFLVRAAVVAAAIGLIVVIYRSLKRSAPPSQQCPESTVHLAPGAVIDVHTDGGGDVKAELQKIQDALKDLSAGQRVIEDAVGVKKAPPKEQAVYGARRVHFSEL